MRSTLGTPFRVLVLSLFKSKKARVNPREPSPESRVVSIVRDYNRSFFHNLQAADLRAQL